jgi:DNA-directed RNA polymerase sigma subunit (sigma70/sigma32)
MRDELSELLEVLDDRERKIILMRFGLDDGKPKILEEIGKKFGVTRERIRQLQNIALAKLRRALAKREKPNVRRDPIQFLKPVSSDPPKLPLHLILESSANDM